MRQFKRFKRRLTFGPTMTTSETGVSMPRFSVLTGNTFFMLKDVILVATTTASPNTISKSMFATTGLTSVALLNCAISPTPTLQRFKEAQMNYTVEHEGRVYAEMSKEELIANEVPLSKIGAEAKSLAITQIAVFAESYRSK